MMKITKAGWFSVSYVPTDTLGPPMIHRLSLSSEHGRVKQSSLYAPLYEPLENESVYTIAFQYLMSNDKVYIMEVVSSRAPSEDEALYMLEDICDFVVPNSASDVERSLLILPLELGRDLFGNFVAFPSEFEEFVVKKNFPHMFRDNPEEEGRDDGDW